jgi:CSLREA domain-containing protein
VSGTTLASHAGAKTFTVNSTADPGNGVCTRPSCTLREAIDAANGKPGADVVRFKVGQGPRTFAPKSELPPITEAVKLDGWTQPGFKRRPLIELRGTAAGSGASGVVVSSAAASTIRGLVINRFDASGIDVGGPSLSGAAKVLGSYIGTDARGRSDRGNGDAGVVVRDLASATIGGRARKQRVVISGNDGDGVRIGQTDVGGAASTIVGSRIGTNAKGKTALPNGGDGIHMSFAWGATIGGPNDGPSDSRGNLISGNGGAGIALDANCLPICTGANVIQGNTIGTNARVTAAIPNGAEGILLDGAGGTQIGDVVGNTISGNGADGIRLSDVAGASVQANAIGAAAGFDDVIPNADDGIDIESSPGQIQIGGVGNDGNFIGGNVGNGIRGASAAIGIHGNLVGLGPGLDDMGNAGNGILVAGGDARIGGTQAGESLNRIAFNGLAGIGVSGGGVTPISVNSIHDNGGLGIDLGLDGPTSNDPLDVDAGPNFLQNRPEITSVVSSGFSTDVTVELDSLATRAYRIELFSNSAGTCDAAGGEGDTFLSSVPLTTDGSGHGSAPVSMAPLPAGTELSATATDTGDAFPWTSEFAACQSVPSS